MTQVAIGANPAVAKGVMLSLDQSALGVAERAKSPAVEKPVHRVCLYDVDHRLDETLVHFFPFCNMSYLVLVGRCEGGSNGLGSCKQLFLRF